MPKFFAQMTAISVPTSAIPGSLIVGLTAAGLDGRLGPTVPGTHG